MRKCTPLSLTCLFLLVYLNLAAQGPTSGGPDAYGYTFKSSANATNGVTANWIDITTRSAAIDITSKFDDDNFFGPLNFSFPFPYYWYTHNELYIQSNGAISFKPDLLAPSFAAIPTAGGATDDYIAAHLTDLTLNKSSSNDGKIYFYSDFKDTVIVSWINVPYFGSPSPGSGCTFQIVLTSDGTIFFNYLKSQGAVNSNGCTADCFRVGIENINGKVGLQHSAVSTGASPFATYLATNPLTIKWFRPPTSAYTIKDASIDWNNVPGNGGIFVPQNSAPIPMRTKIVNQGLQLVPSKQLKASVYVASGNVLEQPQTNTSSGSIAVGEDTVLVLPQNIPTTNLGKFRFQSEFIWPNVPAGSGDEVQANNTLTQLICVVDTTQPVIDLDYTDGTDENVIHFQLVTTPFNAGLGTFIAPPFYPVIITSLNAVLYDSNAGAGPPTGPVRFVLYDDDGKNLFGTKDGSPGTLLFDTIIAASATAGLHKIPVTKNVQINNGGVYIGVLQGTDGAGIGIDIDSKTLSYRSYEVIGGGFTPYRSRKEHDPMIGMSIKKGDVAGILDLELVEIQSPLPTDVITDSVQVKLRLKNIGNQQIAGPFDAAYQANNRPEVIETVPASVFIPVGNEYVYTFNTKAARPPVPKTQFERFCARISLANDFDLTNDTICYEAVGIHHEKNELLTIRPNPGNGLFFLDVAQLQNTDVKIRVYDLSGRMAFKRDMKLKYSGRQTIDLDLRSLPEGMYSYQLISGTTVYTGRLAVMR